MDPILVVTFTHSGETETRTYDFRLSEARKAFVRFTSWALSLGIEFHCKRLSH